MRRHGLPEAHASHPNVTPLIDIVMCLIIFFMLVAKIGVSTGADASIDIPVSTLGKDLKDLGNTLTLNVLEVREQPFITALVDGSSSQPQEVKLVDNAGRRQLLEVLRKLRYGHDARPGGTRIEDRDNDEFKVIIRGDKGISYAVVEPILITCMEANVKNVNFQAAKPK